MGAVVLFLVVGDTAKAQPFPQPEVEFVSWTINGQRVPPGTYRVPVSTIIDAEYTQHMPLIAGLPSLVQAVEFSAIRVHYLGPKRSMRWHVVCHPNAVIKAPQPPRKKFQVCTLDGQVVPRSTVFETLKSRPRIFDVLTAWQLQRSVTYTKRINWIHVGQVTDEEVGFDLQQGDGAVELEACISVVDEDTGEAGVACGPPITLEVPGDGDDDDD
jgi:hypothetical protein